MKHTYVEQYSEKTHHAENQDSEGSVSDLAHSEPNKLVEQVTTSLERLFDQQLEGAHDQGGQVLGSYYKKAQFVMVALADEVFLKLDWLERETWEDNLLEIKFFNTRHAGTAIFDQIKTLIKEKSDRFDRELGQILFWTLGVGFLGKFRDQTNRQELQKYKDDLYRYVLMEKPLPIELSSQKICPEAYRETQFKNIRYLPSPRIYLLAGLVALGVYVLASTVVWNHETYILSEKVDEINSTAEQDLRRK